MDYIRKSASRGHSNLGWLDSHHTFSFGNYYDPEHMGLSVLRVINEDKVIGGAGFGTHGHRDMEIISYVMEGAIKHKDSMGNEFVIPAGEVQRMSAGSGITHSEHNASANEPLRFLQIWIQPNTQSIKPSYEQAQIEQTTPLTPLVTSDGHEGSLNIHQDASLYRLRLNGGEIRDLTLDNRLGYLHVLDGYATSNSHTLATGDGVGMLSTRALQLQAGDAGFEALWFDLPNSV